MCVQLRERATTVFELSLPELSLLLLLLLLLRQLLRHNETKKGRNKIEKPFGNVNFRASVVSCVGCVGGHCAVSSTVKSNDRPMQA